MRVGVGGNRCDGPNANAANIRSIFRYAGAGSGDPNSTAAAPLSSGCYDEQVVPYVKTTVPQKKPEGLSFGFTDTAGSGDLVQWLVNDVPMLVDLEYPTLQHVADGNLSFAKARNVITVGSKNSVSLTPLFHTAYAVGIYINTFDSGNTGSSKQHQMPLPSLTPSISTAMTFTSSPKAQETGLATSPR